MTRPPPRASQIETFFTAPTALRAVRQADPTLALAEGYDLSSLRALFVAGERADPPTVNFFTEVASETWGAQGLKGAAPLTSLSAPPALAPCLVPLPCTPALSSCLAPNLRPCGGPSSTTGGRPR